MDRRRLLHLGLRGLLLASVAPLRGLKALGTSSPDASHTKVPLDAYKHLGEERVMGRVAAIGNLIPSGLTLQSNRDALPPDHIASRLTAGMKALLGPDPWGQVCAPSDTVAIKINGLASGSLSPRAELVQAIVAGLRSAGVPTGRIILWDRTTRELERSGFPRQIGPNDVRAYGTDSLRGGGYDEKIESVGSVGSFVTRILTEYATVLINVGVLKDHDLAGVSAGMKNLYGAIHNPNRYHDHSCDPYVADVTALPSIRRRLRLTIIDGILGQAEAGPAFAPGWIWPCDRILIAVDPVACDEIAWNLIAAQRAQVGLPTLEEAKRAPVWIKTAAHLGLGRDQEIDLLEV